MEMANVPVYSKLCLCTPSVTVYSKRNGVLKVSQSPSAITINPQPTVHKRLKLRVVAVDL
jgi:hypothetical protein